MRTAPRARVLGVFVVAGAVLAALGRLVGARAPELVVAVPAGATPAQIAHATDEALLVDVGLGLGWRDDPVVVDHLTRGLGFVGIDGDRHRLVERAADLDLLRRDPLVRARLAERARALFMRVRSPTDAELDAVVAASPERFRRPTIVRLQHELLDDGPPELVLGTLATRSEAQLTATLGAEATAAIMALPVGVDTPWSAAISSRIGRHRFKVLSKIPAHVPSRDSVVAELTGVWRQAQQADQLAAGLLRLRTERRLRIVELTP